MYRTLAKSWRIHKCVTKFCVFVIKIFSSEKDLIKSTPPLSVIAYHMWDIQQMWIVYHLQTPPPIFFLILFSWRVSYCVCLFKNMYSKCAKYVWPREPHLKVYYYIIYIYTHLINIWVQIARIHMCGWAKRKRKLLSLKTMMVHILSWKGRVREIYRLRLWFLLYQEKKKNIYIGIIQYVLVPSYRYNNWKDEKIMVHVTYIHIEHQFI